MNHTASSPFRVAAALIVQHGRLFIAQRPPLKKFGLLWEFPGGKVEPGENVEETLIREIKEELCWDICIKRLFRSLRHHYPDFSIELHAFWCAISGGKLCLREHVTYRWALLSELSHFNFTQADRELIEFLEILPEFPEEKK